jgi:hypothetical protein
LCARGRQGWRAQTGAGRPRSNSILNLRDGSIALFLSPNMALPLHPESAHEKGMIVVVAGVVMQGRRGHVKDGQSDGCAVGRLDGQTARPIDRR